MKNRFIQGLFLIAFSVLLSLLIGEVAFRFLYADKIVIFPRYVTDVQYNDFQIRRNVPDAHYWHKSPVGKWEFKINSKGFRDTREFEYEKAEGALRILVLGDSFTVGYEVGQQETFAFVLEQFLRKNGINAEVINAGMSGNSNAEELVFLEQEGIKYHPDIVILGFFANDPVDNIKADLYRLKNGKLILNKKEYLPATQVSNYLNSFWIYRWLSEHSYLHNYLNNLATQYFKKRLVQKKASEIQTLLPKNQEQKYPVREYKDVLAAALIQKIYSVSQAHGIKFILLDISHPRTLSHSFPRDIIDLDKVADVYLDSSQLFKPYKGLIGLHREIGHRHWTEFAHLIVGMRLGETVIDLMD